LNSLINLSKTNLSSFAKSLVSNLTLLTLTLVLSNIHCSLLYPNINLKILSCIWYTFSLQMEHHLPKYFKLSKHHSLVHIYQQFLSIQLNMHKFYLNDLSNDPQNVWESLCNLCNFLILMRLIKMSHPLFLIVFIHRIRSIFIKHVL